VYKVGLDSQMPRPRKLKRKGAHLDMYWGIWNSSRSVAVIRILVQYSYDGQGGLTSAEYYNIATNNCTLAIAKVSEGSFSGTAVRNCSGLQANWNKLADSSY